MTSLTSLDFINYFAHTEDHPVRILADGQLLDVHQIGWDATLGTFVITTADQGYTEHGDRYQPENTTTTGDQYGARSE
jgi:hypothetical protein